MNSIVDFQDAASVLLEAPPESATHSDVQIAVLIPCYNEALTIASVVRDFKRYLPQAIVYVYDNNSTDNTASVAAAAGAIVRREPLQGKGNVVRRMFADVELNCCPLFHVPAGACPGG